MAEEVGVAYVRLIPSARGFGRAAEKEMRSELSGPSRSVGEESGDKAGRSFGTGFGKGLTEKSRGLGDGLMSTLRKDLEISGKSVATGFSAQFVASVAAGLASGAAKMAHGIGAIAALLPAVITAGVLAFGTLKLAISGVGDALSAGLAGDTEKFDEALKGLSPSAQVFAREVVGLKDGLDGLKATVQENFFAPMLDRVRPLAELYLPMANTVMGDLARTFGQVGNQVTGFLAIPQVADQIGVAMGHAGVAVGNVASAAGVLPQAFLPLVTVGSTFLPQLTGGLGEAAMRFANFMRAAERTGQLREFIQGGLDKLRELWDTAKQLARIFDNIAEVAAVAFSSVGGIFAGLGIQTGGLLDSFEQLSQRAVEFVRSASGGAAVGEVFSTLGSIVSGTMGFLQRIAVLIGRVFGPIAPQISKLFEAVASLKVAFIDALEPALVSIFGFVGRTVLPALTSFAELLTRNRPLLQGIGIAIATLLLPATISWAAATIAAMAPWILLGAVIAGFAALVIIHFDTIKGVIMGVFNWVQDNWKLLLAILTGPIGIAVGLIVTHWDTIKSAVVAVFNWITDNWQLLLGILIGPIAAAVSFIVSNFDSVVSFVTELPGRIASAASGMWDGITGAFKSAINAIIRLWNGISFPSLTIGGQDPLGDFGPSLPRVTIGGWELPDIPLLHTSGQFRADRAGGEGLAVLKDREWITDMGLGGGSVSHAGSTPAPSALTLNIQSADRWFAEWVRHMVAANAGGDVQLMFGRS